MIRNYGFPASGSVSVLALVFLCVVCMQAANAQTTTHVPADQATIQAAITAAQPGDTVLVAPGTYLENLDFQGKAITVTSSDGPGVTIVDGRGAGPVVTFKSGEGAGSVLNGLTLRNGSPSNTFPFFDVGGGIVILNSSPTIAGNVITGNHAVCGIGMEVQGGSAVIRGNTITGNTQAGGDGGCGGGGIEVTGDFSHPPATPLITGNTITNNSLLGGGFGGGISVGYNASPTIQNNFISRNAVYNSGGGINLQSSSGIPVVVAQNIIVNNSTGGGGSGGGVAASGNAILTDNTIVGNTAFDHSSGIFADRGAPSTISNNIVVAATGQTGIVCSQFSSTFPSFSHNDVTSPGGGQAYSSNCAAAAQGNGNISLDPQFVNATTGDYHLQGASPTIDSGDNSAPNLPAQDYSGNPRIGIGSATTCNDTVDMGAYEFQLTTPSSATLSPVAVDFGAIAPGASSNPQAVTFTASQGCVAKPTIAVSGDYHEADNCSSTLTVGASCSIQITFTPAVGGARPGTLTVSNSNGVFSTSLSGVGAVPNPVFSSPYASFGTQRIGTTVAQSLTLTNIGNAPLSNFSLVVEGPTEFRQTNNCTASLAAGASCTITVTFSPPTIGQRSGNLVISTSPPLSTPAVSLGGFGVAPTASLTPAALTFPALFINTATSQTVTLSNTGNAWLNVSAIAVTGDFSQTNTCGSILYLGGSCSITVLFNPSAAGLRSGVLTVSDDDPASGTQTTVLNGAGIDYIVAASPASVSVKAGGTARSSVAVSAVGGSFPSSVALTCSRLPAGASCSFSPKLVVPNATSASSALAITTRGPENDRRTPRGTYNITVVGSTTFGLVRSTVITLTVR